MPQNQKNKEKASISFSRPPVVVVLGHVDHGKTSLLDAIRKTDVAAGEFGGITQSIGAYQVEIRGESKGEREVGKKITFIDTPGHEAFTKMRSQGASVADIAILVVAANDSVMPQTVESIKIIKEAKIPYIVAINKVDLPEANPDKVIQDLLRHEVMLENYGGDVPFLKISAKAGTGVKELLDLIELMAEVNGVSGDETAPFSATIIESKLDKNRGPLATAIVKNGTVHVGDKVFVKGAENKIRALVDYLGEQIKEATPGMPVEILGLSGVADVGSVITSTSEASQQSLQGETLPASPTQRGEQKAPERAGGQTSTQEATQSLNLILKADTLGSLEAIKGKLPPNTNLLQFGTGEISEADILLARSTKAIILGFNVKVNSQALKLAETEKVLVRTYKIIYELLDELDDAAKGMLEPITREEILGTGQIIAEFPFEKLRIAGTKVLDGRLAKGDLAKITRKGADPEIIGETKIKSVRVGKDEANKVEKGKECGILLDPQVDFRPGDAIISYRIV